ncbi:MAG: alpha-2-macroglobulin [Chitinophagaceae bacterium]|nr:alpha-2-macroglobulin [Chitinophagaceae bacterium]
MRKLFFFALFSFYFSAAYAQTLNKMSNYETRWKSVEQAFKKGLNATAEKEVLQILSLAKAENNTPQMVKAYCQYRVSLSDRDEKADVHTIQYFLQEVKTAKFPVKQILHSMLGELYWNYYQMNRWQILDRTNMAQGNDTQTDMETWSADRFYETASKHYHLSLTEAAESKKYALVLLDPILEQGKNSRILRPTLYDFLVHRAIAYFQIEETELTKPAYAFEINDAKAFASASDFMKATFSTSDTGSNKYQALQRYKDVIHFHYADSDPAALIDVDIARIRYVNDHSVSSNKNELYRSALQTIINRFPNHSQSGLAMYYLAETYTQGSQTKGQRGYMNNHIDDQNIDYVSAKQLLDQIVEKFPNSEAAYLAKLKLQTIEMHTLSVQHEKIVLPERPSLALIQFRNIKKVYVRVVKLSVQEYRTFSQQYTERIKSVVDKKPLKSWSAELPQTQDYKNHTTEIKLMPLPLGVYAILFSESPDFDDKQCANLSFMSVSNLSLITLQPDAGGQTDAYIVHRESGAPMAGVSLKTSVYNYDYQERKNIYKEGQTYVSDQQGLVRFNKGVHANTATSIELIKDEDDLYLNENIYISEYQEQNRDDVRTFLFTDRSIYRPGQKIYYKGIMVQTKGNPRLNNHQLMTGTKTLVRFIDANYQVVKEDSLTTNEYGSFTGSFIAPEGLLTGQFHIEATNGSAFFNIEEYKRPKFEVTFDTIKGDYRLNETVKVKGLAKAYAGNNIDGAQVKYRVLRTARFPYYWCYYFWGRPSSPEMEIVNGTAITKADGSFDISFTAIPDASVDPKTMPLFDYRIDADVTDRNGETRSGTSTMSVSYQSLFVKVEIPNQSDFNDFNALKVFTTNSSNTHIPSTVELSCSRLKAPEKNYRSRLWSKPELYSINESDFRKDFPLDEYKDENDYQQWPVAKVMWKKTIQSSEKGLEYLPKIVNEDGWYLIEARATDNKGEIMIDKQYIRLYTSSNPICLPNEHLLVFPETINAEPGEKLTLSIASNEDPAYVLYHLDRNEKTQTKWINLPDDHSQLFELSEADRGGFYVLATMVRNNRIYQEQRMVSVPWTNKDLTLSMETFRDKILPGSEQEWTLKITGSKKEKVSAELLATMYDASLDAFQPHQWGGFGLYNSHAQRFTTNHYGFVTQQGQQIYYRPNAQIKPYEKSYDRLNWWGLTSGGRAYYRGGGRKMMSREESGDELQSMPVMAAMADGPANEAPPFPNLKNGVKMDSLILEQPVKSKTGNLFSTEDIQLRSNFSETAFFFPQLRTDAAGNILIKFKAPDALTRWKLMAFGHTKNLQSGSLIETSTTSKDLMVVPNTPRFFREGDQMIYSAKVSNLTDGDIRGNAMLQLVDAMTEEPVDDIFDNQTSTLSFSAKQGESAVVLWPIKIPAGFTNPVLVKVFAKAGDHTDGEQNAVPVLLNSMLVTETLPMPVRVNAQKDFRFEKLLMSGQSNTLRHHNLTLEYTSNPAWYAVQSLPYLTDYPYECAEQTFNRYYANILAQHMVNRYPKIKEIFSQWKDKDSAALLSNLQKNEELKSLLLQETPWVLEAKNENQQKKNIAVLFNLNRMSKELERTIRELEIMQTPNGGFAWFKGMPDDRYITQYIATGLGRLSHLGVNEVIENSRVQKMLSAMLSYLDARIKEDYDDLVKHKVDLSKQHISYSQIQYLYMRSFFLADPVNERSQKAFDYYKKQAATYWLSQNRYMQGMIALASQRLGDEKTPVSILKSLRENAIHQEEMGMYWKDSRSYWWYEAPIETQSLLIETFSEIGQVDQEIDELKIWLLKNKQTQNWETTKATADAIYALLLSGTDWLSNEPTVDIQMGDLKIHSADQVKQAGTGYFKMNIESEQIKSDMGRIKVAVTGAKNGGTTWGAAYWQYFENLDKITGAETPLILKKQLFIEQNSDKGLVLIPLSNQRTLKVGDKVKVRIELRVDRDMEYVHMKDMRAACFEPVNVLSEYKYQGGLGYFEATKDAATNFFFHWLSKGTYVFEYPMFVTNQGDFSNGITTIQCMYAPEFSSHSEGLRIKVNE